MADQNTELHYTKRAESANGFAAHNNAVHDAITLMVSDSLPQKVWSALPNGYFDYFNARWYEYTGAMPRTNDGDKWIGTVHSDDRESTWNQWQTCLATGNRYEVEHRLRRHDGEYRWMRSCAEPVYGNAEAIIRWVGTSVDVHERQLALDQCELLAKEMDHRVANLFSIVGSLMSLEAHHTQTAEALAASMRARLASLNAAHRLVRSPVKKADELGASIHSIIRAIAKPYENDQGTRFAVSGPDRTVDDGALTAIALLLHELCTNAIKYGALMHHSGTVAVRTEVDEPVFKLDWIERGGPILDEEPISSGFGTVLIRATVEQQLGGTIERAWTPEGISVELKLPLEALHRHPCTASGLN